MFSPLAEVSIEIRGAPTLRARGVLHSGFAYRCTRVFGRGRRESESSDVGIVRVLIVVV